MVVKGPLAKASSDGRRGSAAVRRVEAGEFHQRVASVLLKVQCGS